MAESRGRAGWLRRRRRGDRGASAVEFAIILPVLLLFLYGIIEFGMVFLIKHGLTEAAADAARAAATTSPQTNAPTAALNQVSSAVNNDVGDLVQASCSSGSKAALSCTATVAQCPNQPSGYNCLTVQLTYSYKNDSNAVLPDLLGITPTISASATVLLSGNLTS